MQMHRFFVALWHLLWRSLSGLVGGWMATSLLALAVGLVVYLVGPWIDKKLHGAQSVKPRLPGSIIAGVGSWVLLFCLSVIQTIYTDHVNLVSTNSTLCAKNDVLQRENAQLKAAPPKVEQKVIVKTVQPQDMPLRITVKEYGGWKLNSGTKTGTAFFILGMTNKTITPVRVTMTCDQDFTKFDAAYLIARGESGVSVNNLSQRQVDRRTYEYSRDSPPWTPESPLGFGIFTESEGTACKIYQNP